MTGRADPVPDRRGEPAPGPRQQARLRIPPSAEQVGPAVRRVARGAGDLPEVAPAAWNYAAGPVMAEVGLRVNEACRLDLADVKWDLGRFGKLHVRHGKEARGWGPRERMVPLINNARATLRWFVEDVWAAVGHDHTRPGVAAALSGAQERRRDRPPGSGRTRHCAPPWPTPPGPHLPDWPDRGHPAARPAALLRLTALPGRHGPDRRPGHQVTHGSPPR